MGYVETVGRIGDANDEEGIPVEEYVETEADKAKREKAKEVGQYGVDTIRDLNEWLQDNRIISPEKMHEIAAKLRQTANQLESKAKEYTE